MKPSHRLPRWPLWAAVGAFVLAGPAAAQAPPREAMARVMVALKPEGPALGPRALVARAPAETLAQLAQQRADALSARAGVALTAGRLLGERALVVGARGIDSRTLASRLAAHPEVAFAEPDRRVRFAALPNDPLYAAGPADGRGPDVGQWYLRPPDATLHSAVNAEGAWSLARGSPSVVVAVLDTGVLGAHPDLAAHMLPGYDMVSDADTANDGDGRDSDAADPGDWITTVEDSRRNGPFEGCGVSDSSWHGTGVAALIGAAADDGVGMAGVAHGVRILPVRVLGKCGGWDSDIIAGITWAAGGEVPGVPDNPHPARVINLSLGAEGPCGRFYRDAVAAATAAGTVVVAAAGNSTGHAVSSPANCPGAVAVTGLRHIGSKVGFSDLGPEITIAAPAGNCINIEPGTPCLYPILTATNSGARGPLASGWAWTDSYNISVGTSFATPIVAGTVALMLSAQPALTPAQVVATLRATARPFPSSGADNGPSDPTPVPMCRAPDGSDQLQCYCTVGLCGAGMLDTAAALLATVRQANPAEVARQLLDFGEQQHGALFPGPSPTLAAPPFLYRYYPATDNYLGVVVQSDGTWALEGVYVMGRSFGGLVPQRVGRVTDFIAPRASAASPARSH